MCWDDELVSILERHHVFCHAHCCATFRASESPETRGQDFEGPAAAYKNTSKRASLSRHHHVAHSKGPCAAF